MVATTIPSSARTELPSGVSSYEAERDKESARSTSLGQAEFLKLMTAQLKNQDPLAPMENGEFLGQMAQFSTVNSVGEMATQLKALADQMSSNRMLSSGSLIGRSVLSASNYGELREGQALDGAVRITKPVDGAVVYIRNAVGQVMESYEPGLREPGIIRSHGMGRFQAEKTRCPGAIRSRLRFLAPARSRRPRRCCTRP